MFKINNSLQKLVNKNQLNLIKFIRLQSTNESGQSNQQSKVESENINNVKNTDLNNQKPATFARLFKESKFVSMGNLKKTILIGRIVDVNGDDLYIDYGGKFNCVCKKPPLNPS
jgi:hypothetical protein